MSEKPISPLRRRMIEGMSVRNFTFLIETSMSGAIGGAAKPFPLCLGTRQARHGLAPGLWRVQIRRTCPRVAWWITRPACHSWPAGGGQQMTIKITPGL